MSARSEFEGERPRKPRRDSTHDRRLELFYNNLIKRRLTTRSVQAARRAFDSEMRLYARSLETLPKSKKPNPYVQGDVSASASEKASRRLALLLSEKIRALTREPPSSSSIAVKKRIFLEQQAELKKLIRVLDILHDRRFIPAFHRVLDSGSIPVKRAAVGALLNFRSADISDHSPIRSLFLSPNPDVVSLGLHYVKTLADRHAGALQAERELPGGNRAVLNPSHVFVQDMLRLITHSAYADFAPLHQETLRAMDHPRINAFVKSYHGK